MVLCTDHRISALSVPRPADHRQADPAVVGGSAAVWTTPRVLPVPVALRLRLFRLDDAQARAARQVAIHVAPLARACVAPHHSRRRKPAGDEEPTWRILAPCRHDRAYFMPPRRALVQACCPHLPDRDGISPLRSRISARSSRSSPIRLRSSVDHGAPSIVGVGVGYCPVRPVVRRLAIYGARGEQTAAPQQQRRRPTVPRPRPATMRCGCCSPEWALHAACGDESHHPTSPPAVPVDTAAHAYLLTFILCFGAARDGLHGACGSWARCWWSSGRWHGRSTTSAASWTSRRRYRSSAPVSS